jgi:imidazole glycerol phosphate synthase glutamine amidotransferase subunit
MNPNFRLIARLDIKNSRLIKGVQFEGLRVYGDPCEKAALYAQQGADELLYIDSVASLYGRNGLVEILRVVSKEVFVPITAGGGVRNVDDARKLLAAGADKVAVNTAAIKRPELITELVNTFGSQCIVLSLQARKYGSSTWEAMSESGRERTGTDLFQWIIEAQGLGVGEILLTSVDNDGTCGGYDLDLLSKAHEVCSVPLIFGGGCSSLEDIINASHYDTVQGVAIGAALHKNILSINELKQPLSNRMGSHRSIRIDDSARSSISHSDILGQFSIGVIDYGIGNQQSLINALEKLGARVFLSDKHFLLEKADLMVLPGVGAFPRGIAELKRRNLYSFIQEMCGIRGHKKPLLGICLGMQMLFDSSSEIEETTGLGLVSGNVKSLALSTDQILPHIGWSKIFSAANLGEEDVAKSAYFVHSYIATEVDPSDVSYYASYGEATFVAAILKDNIAGFQFHPERSSVQGLSLLSKTIQQICNAPTRNL